MTEIVVYQQSSEIQTGDQGDNDLIHLFISTKRSDRTKEQYTHSTRMLLGFIGKPLQSVTLRDAVEYHNWLKDHYTSLHSIKLHVNVAKALFSFGVQINYLRTNVFAVIKTDTTPEVTHKRILSEEQVLRLIEAPTQNRDKVLLRLLYAAGLRVSEVSNLTWGDLLDNGVLHIQNGKGQKERMITLSDGMVERLNTLRGDASQDKVIFVSKKGGRLDESQVHRIVKAAAEVVGISSEASAHWLRHSHASHALDRGANLVTVRDTLGHASIATTNKYLHSKRNDSSALHLAV